MENDTCITFPVLGEPAPDFEAETTQGPLKLSDMKGKWVVMFSHPADFTPVCTTEFLGVTKAEVEEALRVTFLLSGMPAYVYGKAQLDEVMP